MNRAKLIPAGRWANGLIVVAIASMIVAACSSDAGDDAAIDADTPTTTIAGAAREELAAPTTGEAGAYDVIEQDGTVVFKPVSNTGYDAKVIRDGSVDLRISQGSFDTSAGQLRAIASDLGGYVSSGESRIEEYDDSRYAVGWFTLRVPSDRFDDAVDRIEQLGERVSSSLSSQDVTEEYVDLEGRLDYWRDQEAFYRRLMQEATSIEDLVTVQTRMQDVLLNIEQIEGRLRYLDSRTDFATLTVGLTEIPADGPVPVVEPSEPSTISQAFDQAGEVLLATVSFLIVAAAVAIPIGMLVLFAYGVFRLFLRSSRRHGDAPAAPAEG
jgi:hypothetical protein